MKYKRSLTSLQNFQLNEYRIIFIRVCKLLKLFANCLQTLKSDTAKILQLIDNQVPGTGIEPAHSCERQILSLLRLPIPPPGLP